MVIAAFKEQQRQYQTVLEGMKVPQTRDSVASALASMPRSAPAEAASQPAVCVDQPLPPAGHQGASGWR